jgi:hypothetical protein
MNARLHFARHWYSGANVSAFCAANCLSNSSCSTLIRKAGLILGTGYSFDPFPFALLFLLLKLAATMLRSLVPLSEGSMTLPAKTVLRGRFGGAGRC